MADAGDLIESDKPWIPEERRGQPVAWEDANLYHVCDSVVKPRTEQRQCSYMELVATGPQPADYFLN